MQDYYELLGVRSSATGREIKSAYRRLSFAYHPDKNSDPLAEEHFKAINQAYAVLSDPQKRSVYDQRGFYIQTEPETPQPRRHRDPRYQPRPNVRPASDKLSVQEMMEISMRYLVWVNRVGFLLTFLFVLDYVLPYQMEEQTIVNVANLTNSSRGAHISYYLIRTNKGNEIKVYFDALSDVVEGQEIRIKSTLIYSTVMDVQVFPSPVWVRTGYIYGGIGMFPYGVFLCSLIALIFRKRKLDLAFNLSIVCAIFLLITLFIIF